MRRERNATVLFVLINNTSSLHLKELGNAYVLITKENTRGENVYASARQNKEESFWNIERRGNRTKIPIKPQIEQQIEKEGCRS
jgi:hypothetical protein